MSELQLGVIVALVTIAVLLTGTPIAFTLGIVAMGFLVYPEGLGDSARLRAGHLLRRA